MVWLCFVVGMDFDISVEVIGSLLLSLILVIRCSMYSMVNLVVSVDKLFVMVKINRVYIKMVLWLKWLVSVFVSNVLSVILMELILVSILICLGLRFYFLVRVVMMKEIMLIFIVLNS